MTAPLLLVATCSPGPDRPNVVLVVLDTHRAGLLSAYGHDAPTTPRLEAIASEGALFTRAYSTTFWTLPSHASLFTGRYPSEHGATSESNRLSEDATTLAEILSEAAYRTAAYVSNPWLSHERGFAQGFEHFEELWRSGAGGSPDREGVDRASRFVREAAAAEEPFFLFVNLNLAHLPYSPDAAALHAVSSEAHPVDRTRELRKKIVGTWEFLGGAFELDARDFAILRDLYRGEIRMTDEALGRLVDTLAAAGVLDDTLLIVTSDHGENLGDHGMIDHMLSLYETTVRIPLVIRYPARVSPGERVDSLVSLVDIVPTVLDAVGLPARSAAGRSLLDSRQPPPDFVVAENERPINGLKLLRARFPGFDTARIDQRTRMLRDDRYKLIWGDRTGVELYDLLEDPDEQRDLSELRPELRDELLGRLEAWMAAHGRPQGPDRPASTPDPEAEEQLRALGYIE